MGVWGCAAMWFRGKAAGGGVRGAKPPETEFMALEPGRSVESGDSGHHRLSIHIYIHNFVSAYTIVQQTLHSH